ncbi:hypothetical protein [Kitasatospora sp. MMS16-BH015]|uniref:hypothetical protein n=1 Tax=Kitasatospora sp. MMS16-BH015 TaxID=2018025 RepID=UPI00131A588B|nr:hypothetical protein [Kitasatospora sp. MMS16-BH015]
MSADDPGVDGVVAEHFSDAGWWRLKGQLLQSRGSAVESGDARDGELPSEARRVHQLPGSAVGREAGLDLWAAAELGAVHISLIQGAKVVSALEIAPEERSSAWEILVGFLSC